MIQEQTDHKKVEKSTGAQRMKKNKREENKSHSYIKTFSWHVSASTVMKSKVIWNACCLLSCSSLTTEGLCLGGSPQRGDFLYWDYLTWVGGEAGSGWGRQVQVGAEFRSQPGSCGSSLPHHAVHRGSLFSEGGVWGAVRGEGGRRGERER